MKSPSVLLVVVVESGYQSEPGSPGMIIIFILFSRLLPSTEITSPSPHPSFLSPLSKSQAPSPEVVLARSLFSFFFPPKKTFLFATRPILPHPFVFLHHQTPSPFLLSLSSQILHYCRYRCLYLCRLARLLCSRCLPLKLLGRIHFLNSRGGRRYFCPCVTYILHPNRRQQYLRFYDTDCRIIGLECGQPCEKAKTIGKTIRTPLRITVTHRTYHEIYLRVEPTMSPPTSSASSKHRRSSDPPPGLGIKKSYPTHKVFSRLHKYFGLPIPGEDLPRNSSASPELVARYEELTEDLHVWCYEKFIVAVDKLISSHASMTRTLEFGNNRGNPPKPQSQMVKKVLEPFVRYLETERREWQAEGGSSRGNFSTGSGEVVNGGSLSNSRRTTATTTDNSGFWADVESEAGVQRPPALRQRRTARPLLSNGDRADNARRRRRRTNKNSETTVGTDDDDRYEDPDSMLLDEESPGAKNKGHTRTPSEESMKKNAVPKSIESIDLTLDDDSSETTDVDEHFHSPPTSPIKQSRSVNATSSNYSSSSNTRPNSRSIRRIDAPPTSLSSSSSSANLAKIPGSFPESRPASASNNANSNINRSLSPDKSTRTARIDMSEVKGNGAWGMYKPSDQQQSPTSSPVGAKRKDEGGAIRSVSKKRQKTLDAHDDDSEPPSSGSAEIRRTSRNTKPPVPIFSRGTNEWQRESKEISDVSEIETVLGEPSSRRPRQSISVEIPVLSNSRSRTKSASFGTTFQTSQDDATQSTAPTSFNNSYDPEKSRSRNNLQGSDLSNPDGYISLEGEDTEVDEEDPHERKVNGQLPVNGITRQHGHRTSSKVASAEPKGSSKKGKEKAKAQPGPKPEPLEDYSRKILEDEEINYPDLDDIDDDGQFTLMPGTLAALMMPPPPPPTRGRNGFVQPQPRSTVSGVSSHFETAPTTRSRPSGSTELETITSSFIRGLENLADPVGFYNLPFHVIFEATRVARYFDYSLEHWPLQQLFSAWVERLAAVESLADFWEVMKGIKGAERDQMPVQPSANVWSNLERLRKDESGDKEWDNTIEPSCDAEFEKVRDESFEVKKSKLVIAVNPKPLENKGKTNKFYRFFGSHRFLIVKLPIVNKDSPKEAAEILKDWQRAGTLELFGRVWKSLYVRQDAKVKKIVFFAVSGPGLTTWSIRDVIQWHIPLEGNERMTVAKFWSRIALGFSTTKPTITFDSIQSQIRIRRDTMSGNEVMDDGCAMASPAVFRAVRAALNLPALPYAVQARIGGAKGIWMVDPMADMDSEDIWIDIKDSQLKFVFHQDDYINPEPARLTLDVLHTSRISHNASLNKQFIPILSNGGVPHDVFRELVEEDIHREIGELIEKIDDPQHLKKWLEERSRHGNRSTRDGALPKSKAEAAVLLLDAGFEITKCSYLWKLVFESVKQHCDELKERLHICIPRSAKAYCVADPTGTLREGEISFRFSTSKLDEKSSMHSDLVMGDVIVSRNPAYLPRDVQKVVAVDNPALRNLKDVVVFSTQGEKSLASYLSGGDYDGDEPWVCWDPRIVKPFRNVIYEECAIEKSDYFIQHDTTMADLIRKYGRDSDEFFSEFMEMGMESHFTDARLGIVSKMFDDHTYTYKTISDEWACKLAMIFETLIDAPKQGLKLKDQQWKIIKKHERTLKSPYYSQKNRMVDLSNVKKDKLHILDFIKLVVAKEQVEAIFNVLLTKIGGSIADTDEELTSLFNEESLRSRTAAVEKSVSPEGDADDHARIGPLLARERYEVVKCLELDLSALISEWKNRYDSGGEKVSPEVDAAFKESFFAKYEAIMPRMNNPSSSHTYRSYNGSALMNNTSTSAQTFIPHSVAYEWSRHANKEYSQWKLLKASCFFFKQSGKGKLVWATAGKELMYIKALARGVPLRILSEESYSFMKTKKAALNVSPQEHQQQQQQQQASQQPFRLDFESDMSAGEGEDDENEWFRLAEQSFEE